MLTFLSLSFLAGLMSIEISAFSVEAYSLSGFTRYQGPVFHLLSFVLKRIPIISQASRANATQTPFFQV